MRKVTLILGLASLLVGTIVCKDSGEEQGQTEPTTEATQEVAQVVTTESGLKYIDHVIGDGAEAVAGQPVKVHYTGWLYENEEKGAKFDSSRDRNQPFDFQLGAGRVIKGWDEGVAGMKVGGQRELIIPPELGYGAQGAGAAIPPNATLVFDVELLQVGN